MISVIALVIVILQCPPITVGYSQQRPVAEHLRPARSQLGQSNELRENTGWHSWCPGSLVERRGACRSPDDGRLASPFRGPIPGDGRAVPDDGGGQDRAEAPGRRGQGRRRGRCLAGGGFRWRGGAPSPLVSPL